MPATDYHHHESSSSPSSFGFSILSRRRDQVHSMDPTHGHTGLHAELESFQRQVAERFHDLASGNPEDLLSIAWVRKLLDTYLLCQEQFRIIILNNRAALTKPPMDRHISEFFERSVKALDVCNAIRDGVEQIRQWQKLLDIVLCSLNGNGDVNINNNSQKSIGEGQFRRAKKALVELALAMIDAKESSNSTVNSHRNRSFGRHQQKEPKSLSNFRSLSWSVSRSWSASRQLQAIGNNLVGPKPTETASTGGLNVAVFTMNYVLLFVMWALVAAIPCQDRGLQVHFYYVGTRQFAWASPILSLHERILEESKKRERRNTCGLLREISDVEKCARFMNELMRDFTNFPLDEKKEREVRSRVREVGLVYEGIKEGLDPLERSVREVFRRIVRVRTDGLDSTGGRVNS
ncbi:Protein of unknown function (DUF793 [Striga hermonthica]|uniref:Uncharacterized protein n=1 Tax=Striga hermonthica TaxID=68872 RepID=A0A9N7RRK8_STRHE|nr:Protein of unknown function (DUF793 [Striga hermonthica]